MPFLPKKMVGRIIAMVSCIFLLHSTTCLAFEHDTERWVNLNKEYKSLADLFKVIKSQTGLTLFYSNDVLNDNEKVQVRAGRMKLDDLLGEVLGPREIGWIYKEQFIILQKKSLISQVNNLANANSSTENMRMPGPVTLTGTVLTADGRPIEGVSVQVKGTKIGTTTKADGRFELREIIKESPVLIISSVGYQKQEMAVGGKTSFNIVLAAMAPELEDVVVIGYGSRKKSDLTGSVASVSSDNLKERPVSNFGEAMAGQLAGVQVQQINGAPGGEGLSVRVRGTGSITQSSSPLYVVDGYPMEDGAFSLINPSDIESLQVLKDASSTAIYGSRGANGVVIITTKKGKSGRTSISFNAFAGVQERTKTMPVMGRDEYVQWFMDGRNQAWLDQPVISSDPDKSPHTINDPNSRRAPYPSSNSLYMIPDGQSGYKYNFRDPASIAQMPDNNWQDLLFRRAPMQQYQLSATGGSEKTTYAFSGSYIKQDGISLNTNYRRFNFRNNVESRIAKQLKIGMNLNAYSSNGREQANGKDAPILYSLLLPPIFELQNADGTYGSMVRNPEVLAGDVANPIGIANQVQRFRKRYGWLGTLYAEWDVIENLKYRININGSIQNNDYETYEPSTVDFDGSRAPRPARGVNDQWTRYDWVVEQTLSYAKKFGENHDMVLLGGFSSQKHDDENIYGEARGFPNDAIQTLNAGTPYQLSSTKSSYSMISYFGRANYTFNNRYLLTATVRTDGSSRFGQNKKWGVFPSASVAWRVSEENFMAPFSQTINDLKFRGSYGIAGNNRIGNYSAIGLLSTGFYPTGDALQTTVNPSTVPNDDLGWEKILQSNVGFDLGLFNNQAV